jgi:tRNA 2-thiocytidine biosynthesis protein TtcA
MKRLVEELGKEIPNVRQSVLNAMGNVRPSHLLDKNLFDFEFSDGTPEAQQPEGTKTAARTMGGLADA